MGLDKTRYEGYIQYTLNNERQAIGVFPTTTAEVIAGAESLLSTTQPSAHTLLGRADAIFVQKKATGQMSALKRNPKTRET